MAPHDHAGTEVLAPLGDGVAVFGPDGRLAETNAALRRYNLPLEPYLSPGTPWDLFLREAERRAGFPDALCTRLRQVAASSLAGPTSCDPFEAALSGGRIYAFRLSPLDGGGFVLVQSPCDEGRAEAGAAREAEALLRKVLEASPVSLTMSRVSDGKVIYRSPAATELLGTAESSFAHFAHHAERTHFLAALLPGGRVDDMRVTGLRADGAAFPAQLSARLIEYGGEDVVVSTVEDLTEQIAVETELARNREQLFQAEKMSAMGELLAGVAHELNNPLSLIVGHAGILREDLEGTVHEARLARLGNAAERCIGIVRSFLSMARETPLSLVPVRFAEIAEIAIEATFNLATTTGVTVTADAAPDLPPLRADRVQLAQVLINLVTNAIDAIHESGTGSSVTLGAARGRQGMVTIRVADDGPGVDGTIRGRIFEPLFTTKAPGKGTGVGLAFCMRAVTAHKGSLVLEPASGRGATFTLGIPAAEG